MKVYLRARNAPVPYEVDANALNYWLSLALSPARGDGTPTFLPESGNPVTVDAAASRRILTAIEAFAMGEGGEDDPIQILAASRLLQVCRNPPFTIAVK